MKPIWTNGLLVTAAAFFMMSSISAEPVMVFSKTNQKRNERMAWWRDARFGMFIHWGIYAIPGGAWDGKVYGFAAEWIMDYATIPVDEYEPLAKQFNPVKFDAKAWVRLAKDAGMKYIVITTKHHDGFCLFDSKYTDYDIMDATPFKRDIMKELADECHQQGIKIGWYYSIWDWHHRDYLPRWKWDTQPVGDADFSRYFDYLKNQITELLTNYGKISVLWFDGGFDPTWTVEITDELEAHIRSLQPKIIINNRIGKPWPKRGDFITPERKIPEDGFPRADWESCMTSNRSWGFKKDDHDWKSTQEILHMLIECASKGGNLLFNVGPDAQGVIPEPATERLKQVGQWLAVNGDSVYETEPAAFYRFGYGMSTAKPGYLYLHIFDWPEKRRIEVRPILNKIKKAYLLADPEKKSLPMERLDMAVPDGESTLLTDKDRKRLNIPLPDMEYRIYITLPDDKPDPIDSVVVIEVEGMPEGTWCSKLWYRLDTVP